MAITRRLPGAYVTALNNASAEADFTMNPVIATGTADIDISASVYTGYITLLTIEPESAALPLFDLQVDLAYNLATSGVSAVATNNDTLDVQVVAKADDTNYSRIAVGTQCVLTGSASPIVSGERFKLGVCDGIVAVQVKLSAERADAEIPYKVTYRSEGTATITPVAAA
jgi:hypothetical protein